MNGTAMTHLGSLGDFPRDRCVAVCDARAVAVRIGDHVSVLSGKCLHADQSLAGGVVSHGVLMCPHHFWRYDGESGSLLGLTGPGDAPSLESYPTEIIGDEVYAKVPLPPPVRSTREMLREHARTWNRDDTSPAP